MTGMNDRPLKPPQNLSYFFYESKLYDYSQKRLSDFERNAMKAWAEESPEAKHSLGSLLMALEYLEKINTVSIEFGEEKLLKELQKSKKKSRLLHFGFFIFLCFVFLISGYYCIQVLLSPGGFL